MKSIYKSVLFFCILLISVFSYAANKCNISDELNKILDSAEDLGEQGAKDLKEIFGRRILSDDEIYPLFDDIVGEVPAFQVGDLLSGSGTTALKDIYSMNGVNEGLVLAVAKRVDPAQQAAQNRRVLDEIELLDELDAFDIPTIRFSVDNATFEGRQAFAMERMVASSRDLIENRGGRIVAKSGSDVIVQAVKLNKENSLASLRLIKQRVEEANVEIEDLQFLFDKNGRFVVNDPEKIVRAADGGNVAQSVKDIDQVIDFIEQL